MGIGVSLLHRMCGPFDLRFEIHIMEYGCLDVNCFYYYRTVIITRS